MNSSDEKLGGVWLRASLLAASALLNAGLAHGANRCDAPVPPPSCNGLPDPSPPPAPPPPLQRPQIDAFGDDFNHRIYIGVKAQPAELLQVNKYSVQTAPSAAGPWTYLQTNLAYNRSLDSNANVVTYSYSAPTPQLCTRARVQRSNTDVSPWSVTKCALQSPVPSSVQVVVNAYAMTVRWVDQATLDVAYAILYKAVGASSYSYYIAPGTYGTTGNRAVTIPIASPYNTMCVIIWPLEIAPGYIGGYASTDYSDSTPMSPYHWKSSEVCGGFNF